MILLNLANHFDVYDPPSKSYNERLQQLKKQNRLKHNQ